MVTSTNFKAFAFASAALGTIVGVGCAPLAGPVDVEVIVNQDGTQGFELGVVTIETAVDLNTGQGTKFDVLGGVKAPSIENIGVVGNVAEYPTFEDVVERNREIAGGTPVAPELTVSDGVVRGTDFDSLSYLTIFYNFERAFQFFEESAGDDSGATQFKGEVGFYAEVVASSVFPVPIIGADNAAYFGPTDGWLTLRVSDTESIPLAMNDGVIAHEFGHRSFFHNVFRSDESAYDVYRYYTGNALDTDAATARALNLLRAVDEGIADLHAISYTNDPEFLAESLRSAPGVVDERNPDGAFATIATYQILDDRDLLASTGVGCTGVDISSSGFNFYCLGTVFLRALWLAAEQNVAILRDEISPAVRRSLPALGLRIAAETSNDEVLDFEIEYLLEVVAQEVPEPRRTRLCEAFRLKFVNQINSGRVPTCF